LAAKVSVSKFGQLNLKFLPAKITKFQISFSGLTFFSISIVIFLSNTFEEVIDRRCRDTILLRQLLKLSLLWEAIVLKSGF